MNFDPWSTEPEPTPGPSMPDIQGMFNQACDQIADAIKTVIDRFNALVKHINDNRFLLGPAMLVLKGIMDRMRTIVDKAAQLAKYVAEHHIPVLALILQSFNWTNHVHNPMSNLSAPSVKWADENYRNWTGAAADAYKDKATEQKAAIDEYVKKSEFISTWLFVIVKTNVDYVASLGGMIAKIAGEMVGAAAEGATVFELPWAADRLAGVVSTVIEEGMKTLIQYAQNFVGALSNIRDASSQLGDHTVFTDGKWPEAVRN